MGQDRKKIKKEKKRLKAIREMKEHRNIAKRNIDFIFPKKRDIRFSDPKEKK
ncbi:hypothetical protein ES702_07117 [subsurface metagenome]